MGAIWQRESLQNDPAPGFDSLSLHTDALWRPTIAQRHGAREPDPIRTFHDGPKTSLSVSRDASHISLTGQDDVGHFASVALELPKAFRTALKPRHILRLQAALAVTHAVQTYARLNLRHGPDTYVITRTVQPGTGPCLADFDLASTG